MKATLDIRQTADGLEVEEKTIRRWNKSGRLPAVAGTGGQGRALRFDVETVNKLRRQLDRQRDTSTEGGLARMLAGFINPGNPKTTRFWGISEYWLLRRQAEHNRHQAVEARQPDPQTGNTDMVRAAQLETEADALEHQAARVFDRCLHGGQAVPENVAVLSHQVCANCTPEEIDFFCAYLFAARNIKPSAYDTAKETAANAWTAIKQWTNQRAMEATLKAGRAPVNYAELFRDYRQAMKGADYNTVFQLLWGVPAQDSEGRETGRLESRGILNDGVRQEKTVREYASALCKLRRAETRRWQKATAADKPPSTREVATLYGCNPIKAWRIMARRSGILKTFWKVLREARLEDAPPVIGRPVPRCPHCESVVSDTAVTCPHCKHLL